MMSDKSHLKMEAISRLKISLIKSECSIFLFCLKAVSLAFLRKCKSSVSRIFTALEAFSEPIVLLAGGHDKNTGLEEMMELVCQKVKDLILLGDAAARFKEAAQKAGFAADHIYDAGYSMGKAVELAAQLAESPQVVLLSPACASFDMFDDYEARGRKFKEIVQGLC